MTSLEGRQRLAQTMSSLLDDRPATFLMTTVQRGHFYLWLHGDLQPLEPAAPLEPATSLALLSAYLLKCRGRRPLTRHTRPSPHCIAQIFAPRNIPPEFCQEDAANGLSPRKKQCSCDGAAPSGSVGTRRTRSICPRWRCPSATARSLWMGAARSVSLWIAARATAPL